MSGENEEVSIIHLVGTGVELVKECWCVVDVAGIAVTKADVLVREDLGSIIGHGYDVSRRSGSEPVHSWLCSGLDGFEGEVLKLLDFGSSAVEVDGFHVCQGWAEMGLTACQHSAL